MPGDGEPAAAGSAPLSRRANRTAIAFAAVVAFAELSPAIPHHPPPQVNWWIGGVVLTVLAGLVRAITGGRSRLLRYVPLLLFMAAVQMLRAADGNGSAGFLPLLILPVVWYALYGNRVGVVLALAGVAAVNLGPLVLVGPPDYPVTLWRAAVLWLIILALCGLVAVRLVAAIREKSAALTASEVQFRTAFADAPTGVAIISAAGTRIGTFLQVNRAMAAMLGRAEDEIVGRSILDFTHPADRSITERALLAPEERQLAQTIRKRYLHSSGREVPVTITYSRIQSQPGLEPRLIAHIMDTTERHEAQLEMLKALGQEKQANTRLRRAEQTRADLLTTATHELYEPLVGIRETLNKLQSAAGAALTAQQLASLREVEHQVVVLLGIVDELGNILRLSDDGERTTEPVDIAAVVQSAIDSIRPIAQSHDLALQTDLNLAGAQVNGQAVNIERVLINLLDNAVKFTPPGGAVDTQARVRNDSVIIDVTDTGIGIRPEEQERIFDQFYRAREAAQRSIPGAGLGLAIAKAIADQHHGAISIFSEPGVGSTFTLMLPLRKQD